MYKYTTMKYLFSALLLCVLACPAFAQDNAISRIQIRHADPQLIIMLLNAMTDFNTPPEMSTNIFGNNFGGGFGGGFGGSNFGGGSGFGGSNFGSGFGNQGGSSSGKTN